MTPTNPKTTWKSVWDPSAKTVQRQYVKAREKEFEAKFPEYKKKTIDLLKQDPYFSANIDQKFPQARQAKNSDFFYGMIFDELTKTLQNSDLTINFKLEKWFSTENKFSTYSQMYERRIVDGRMVFSAADVYDDLNPAMQRVASDDRVTIQKNRASGSGTQPSQPAHGLMQGTRSPEDIAKYMRAGKEIVDYNGSVVPNDVLNKTDKGYESPNPFFNPKTKQIFAALNYGNRPHGSCTEYGDCHFILNPKFKAKAFYYPYDTFYVSGMHMQVNYESLGAILLYAKPEMRIALFNSILGTCFNGKRLELQDTNMGSLLLEAHIFAEVHLNKEDVSELVINKEKRDKEKRDKEKRDSQARYSQVLMNNAVKFCKARNIKFTNR